MAAGQLRPRAIGYFALLIAAWLAMVGVAVGVLVQAQSSARSDERQEFALRSAGAANVAGNYVNTLEALQRGWARAVLSGPTVPRDQTQSACATIGFTRCGVLDDHARVLSNAPYLGQYIGQDFSVLKQVSVPLRTGKPYVTPVYFAPGHKVPVVALGVPFDTPQGRRVFTGMFMVQDSALLARLSSAVAVPGRVVYVVDPAGNVAARSDGPLPAKVTSLAAYAPALAAQLGQHPTGTVGGRYYASGKIAGTPWRLVTTVSTGVLYEPVSGFAVATWWIVGTASVLGLLAAVALTRTVRRQAQIRTRADWLEREIRIRQRYAHQVNDAIVQDLVAAETAYDLGQHETARRLLGRTSRRARDWIGELLTGVPSGDGLRPPARSAARTTRPPDRGSEPPAATLTR